MVGLPGVGKSITMLIWALELIRQDVGVIIVDPHGSLYDEMLAHLAGLRHLWKRVVLIDPTSRNSTETLNPLELRLGDLPRRRAQYLTSVLLKVFHADEVITARMQECMRHTFWLACISGLTLVECKRILVDKTYRFQLLKNLPDHDDLKLYWTTELPKHDDKVLEWAQSTLNKISPFIDDEALKAMFGARESTLDFRRFMDEQKIVLVNLAKGVFGDSNSRLLGAFIVAQLQLAALSRADQKYVPKIPFIAFLDEFQTYSTDEIHEII